MAVVVEVACVPEVTLELRPRRGRQPDIGSQRRKTGRISGGVNHARGANRQPAETARVQTEGPFSVSLRVQSRQHTPTVNVTDRTVRQRQWSRFNGPFIPAVP